LQAVVKTIFVINQDAVANPTPRLHLECSRTIGFHFHRTAGCFWCHSNQSWKTRPLFVYLWNL